MRRRGAGHRRTSGGHSDRSDGGTTIGALALGAAEANPLGLATVVLKYPLLQYCKGLPEDERTECYSAANAVWGGAAVNNVCVIAAILTGGAFAPVCIAAGIGYGVYAWNDTTPEQDFYTACAEYRRVSGESFRCEYQLQTMK